MPCAYARPGVDASTSNSSAIVVVTGAASAGSFVSANAKLHYGRSAMPVPSAITPNPNQIQFTSGLTTSCSVAD